MQLGAEFKTQKSKFKNKLLRIVINADDYGSSKNFNKGIIYCAKRKLITSTTVMVDRPHVGKEAIIQIRRLSIGLHLEFKDIENVKNVEEVISAQYNKFLRIFSKKPSHIDGHRGCLIYNPKILAGVIKLAKKEGFAIRSDQLLQNKQIKNAGIKTTDGGVIWITKRQPNEIMWDLNKLTGGHTN